MNAEESKEDLYVSPELFFYNRGIFYNMLLEFYLWDTIFINMKRIILLLLIAVLYKAAYGVKPNISFYCELNGKDFSELLSDTALIRQLVKMHVSIRVGLHDFSVERTSTIQKLNKAGVPVYAWLLLPEEDGYWFNMHNGDKAGKRYDDFLQWTRINNLKWEGIGIDLELDINDAKMALNHPYKLIWKVYKRLYDNKSLKNGKEVFQALIEKMKADSYTVESYVIPFIFEERARKTTSLQKLMGIVDIETEREIPMLYTSAMRNPGIIPLYHHDNMPVALGSTGGGVNIEGIELASLSWDELEGDLLIASKLTDQIIIFCLETSVRKGFLHKINGLDWNQQAPDISVETAKQAKINRFAGSVLVVLNHPIFTSAALLLLIGALVFGLYKLIRLIFRIIFPKRQVSQ